MKPVNSIVSPWVFSFCGRFLHHSDSRVFLIPSGFPVLAIFFSSNSMMFAGLNKSSHLSQDSIICNYFSLSHGFSELSYGFCNPYIPGTVHTAGIAGEACVYGLYAFFSQKIVFQSQKNCLNPPSGPIMTDIPF